MLRWTFAGSKHAHLIIAIVEGIISNKVVFERGKGERGMQDTLKGLGGVSRITARGSCVRGRGRDLCAGVRHPALPQASANTWGVD